MIQCLGNCAITDSFCWGDRKFCCRCEILRFTSSTEAGITSLSSKEGTLRMTLLWLYIGQHSIWNSEWHSRVAPLAATTALFFPLKWRLLLVTQGPFTGIIWVGTRRCRLIIKNKMKIKSALLVVFLSLGNTTNQNQKM